MELHKEEGQVLCEVAPLCCLKCHIATLDGQMTTVVNGRYKASNKTT